MGLKARRTPALAESTVNVPSTRPLQDVIRDTVREALERHSSLRQAATALQIPPSSLSDMARRYGIKVKSTAKTKRRS